MVCPLDNDPSSAAYWSCSPRDKVFGAHYDAFATQFTGYSVCHPIYADAVMHRATQHAIRSAITAVAATATFMILPTQRGTGNAYKKLIWANPSLCIELGTIKADALTYSTPARWDGSRSLPRPKHDLKIIVIWNTAARDDLAAHCPGWIEGLRNDIKEACWNYKSHTTIPNPTGLIPSKRSCPRKFKDLRPDTQLTLLPSDPMQADLPPLVHSN